MPQYQVQTKFSSDLCSKNDSNKTLVVEASDLGWPPGIFPDSVVVENLSDGLWDSVTFLKCCRQHRREVVAYQGDLSAWRLEVLND